jgi:hypothetical protein
MRQVNRAANPASKAKDRMMKTISYTRVSPGKVLEGQGATNVLVLWDDVAEEEEIAVWTDERFVPSGEWDYAPCRPWIQSTYEWLLEWDATHGLYLWVGDVPPAPLDDPYWQSQIQDCRKRAMMMNV